MCGIAGIFSHSDAALPVDREELRAVRDSMARRGPDGQGEFFTEDGRLGLGHRRLAIIDLSPDGLQPMFTSDRRFVIVFNGEIYNYRALREGLQRRGRRFRTSSDTEVILELYRERGRNAVHALRGMFALAIWDFERRTLFLARDPFGIKPLYYADDGRVFRFASQVKALRRGGGVGADPDTAAVAGFFLMGSVPEPLTLLRGVRQLRAGHTLEVGASGCAAPERYFSLPEVFTHPERPQAGEEGPAPDTGPASSPGELFLDSVRHHLVADVEVGAFLSAGIDSTAIVALARQASAVPPRTVTLAFEEFRGTGLDEAPLAEQTARRLGTRHETRTISRQRFLDEVPRILDAMDQPTIDGVNSYFVSQVTAESGLKVALSGLGGDELLGGYPTFRDLPWLVRGARIPSLVPGLGRALRPLLASLGGRIPRRYAELFEHGGGWAGAYRLRRGLFGEWELPAILGREIATDGVRALDSHTVVLEAITPDPGGPFARICALEAGLYMRNQLLRDTDWASMAHSLEVRVPLVDAPLWRRLAARLGPEGRGRGKQLLAEAPSPPIPSEQLRRPKSGFYVPVWEWAGDAPGLDAWRGVSALHGAGFQGPRRWAFTVFGALAAELGIALR